MSNLLRFTGKILSIATKQISPSSFKESWESLTISLITTGFRKCGIVPLNRNAIDEKRLVNSNCQDSLTNTCINDILVSSSNNSSLLNATPVEF